MKRIRRTELGRVQVSGRLEDPIIQREQRDRGQSDPGASGGQFAVAARRASALHDEQGTAEELSARKLATQSSALGL